MTATTRYERRWRRLSLWVLLPLLLIGGALLYLRGDIDVYRGQLPPVPPAMMEK